VYGGVEGTKIRKVGGMQQKKLISGIALLASVFTGCFPAYHPPPPQPIEKKELVRTVAFDPAAFAAYASPGSGKLCGQAFMKTRGGDVKLAAGNEIRLLPDNAYSRQTLAFLREIDLNEPLRILTHQDLWFATDPRAAAVSWVVQADGDGRFCFEKLPPGRYLAFTRLHWLAGTSDTGGIPSGSAEVAEGATATVMVTG
jgi:hypothetical protein